jgi:hypothetical protein
MGQPVRRSVQLGVVERRFVGLDPRSLRVATDLIAEHRGQISHTQIRNRSVPTRPRPFEYLIRLRPSGQ